MIAGTFSHDTGFTGLGRLKKINHAEREDGGANRRTTVRRSLVVSNWKFDFAERLASPESRERV